MKERIKELAEQAGASVMERSGWTDFGTMDLDVEKFVELIVRECIKELEETKSCDPYNGELFDCDYNNALVHGIANIKEHFGVER